jgi:hypothetical protein
MRIMQLLWVIPKYVLKLLLSLIIILIGRLRWKK